MKKREIKFRAWLLEAKKDGRKMFSPEEVWIHPMRNNSQICEVGLPYKDTKCWYTNKQAILMQYTGKKDKNNREIYEGDILLLPNKKVVEVKWENFNGWTTTIARYFGKIEVIGNIYENRGLLKLRSKK
jgi:uncharacterized phage protein (TIGR01671 family)